MFFLDAKADVFDQEVECRRIAEMDGCGLDPVLDQAQEFVCFEPVFDFELILGLVLQSLLILFDDSLSSCTHVREFFQTFLQLPSEHNILCLELINHLLADFVDIDDISDSREGQNFVQQFGNFQVSLRQEFRYNFADTVDVLG